MKTTFTNDAVYIGQATSDERGKTTGGRAGDQTGKEVAISKWSYSSNNTYNTWKYVFRAKDTAARTKIAQAAIKACENDCIGYDISSPDRKTCFKAAQKVNFDMSKITTTCEVTCSELVNVCIAAAGLKSYLPVDKPANIVALTDVLKKSSEFITYTDVSYTTKKTKLLAGDILMSGTHTVVVVKVPTKKTTTEIAKEVIAGKWGSGDTRKKKLEAAGYNYNEVQKKVNELLAAKKTWSDNANAWARKIAKSGKYKYKRWSSNVNTHKCPICHSGVGNGWNCIGFAFACWHHGGKLKSKCNCGVVSNERYEQLLKAKTTAEASKMATQLIGVPVKVIRNGGKSVASKCKKGDIGVLFNGKTYYHTFYCMGNMKYADSTSGRTPNIKADNAMSAKWKNNFKLIIRYVGDDPTTKSTTTKTPETKTTTQKTTSESQKSTTPKTTPSETKVLKAYTGVFPSIKLKKTNAEVIRDAIIWGHWIAGDNDFHYGYTNKAKKADAHHNGCYFCGTQHMKKNMLMPEHTYCCNPFIGAAWAHGGGDAKALELCKKCNSWDFNKGAGYDKSSLFKNLGKPARSSLKKGDVLCTNSHVMMYVGNGKIMEAAYGDDNVRNSKKWNNSIHITSLTASRYAGVKRVHRYIGSVDVSRAIEHGEVGKRVEQLQAYLNWYFGKKVCGTPDGLFGDITLKYVKKFQKERKLTVDGKVGPKTIEEMKKVKK